MKKYLLLAISFFIFHHSFSQTFKTSFDQLVFVNDQWKNQKDINAALNENAARPLNEQQLIQLHLRKTEKLLRKRKVNGLSPEQQKARLANLNTLHEYMAKGIFPVNDQHQNRQPYFIDKYNTYCAVGYLMKESGGDGIAKDIQATQNYSYLADITHPKLMDWVAKSGLTLDELGLIQPSYGDPTPSFVNELHYNNTGTDINEYIEIHRDDQYSSRRVMDSIIFYNTAGAAYKRMIPAEMKSMTYNNNTYLYYSFPATDTFADAGRIELKGHLFYPLPDTFPIQTIIYNSDSVVVKSYETQSSFPPRPPFINTYMISENETTPPGMSLNFCNSTPPYNLTLQSMIASPGIVNCLTFPVTLSNFSYSLINKKVLLSWETFSENNSKSFSIERSADGINFTEIGKAKAAGSSSEKRKYAFTDDNPRYINQYRLKQLDSDGKYVYSKILLT